MSLTSKSDGHVASPPAHLMILDDESVFRRMLRLHLEREGWRVSEAENLESARRLLGLNSPSLKVNPVDLVLCDWRLSPAQISPDTTASHHDPALTVRQPHSIGTSRDEPREESGLTMIDEIVTSSYPHAARRPEILFMSAHAPQQIALDAIERGASDFIVKPFEMSELIFRVKKLLRERARELRLYALEAESTLREDQLCGLVGRTPKMSALFDLIRRVAPSQSKLLIQGESGTGKELVARALHQLSLPEDQVRHAPFVALNCASLPESLIESELFGHTQGAFTHAHNARRGLIEEAHGGTLFLDEIGELPLHLQAKLLRVIQESEVRRLGANQPIKLKVRFIAATLKDLAHEVKEGRFRGDLYYRLNVITLELPPLRERLEDIPLLVHHLMTRICQRQQRAIPKIHADVLTIFKRYSWPGNVRELENALEHALILSEEDQIHVHSLPHVLQTEAGSFGDLSRQGAKLFFEYIQTHRDADHLSIKRLTQALEESLIREALSRTGGVKTQAAKMLEISTKTLLYKLRDYQIDLDD